MKKCTNCNFVNPDSEKFCGECGTVLPETTVPTPQDPMNIYREALINAIADGKVPVAARRNLMEIQMQYNLDAMKVFELEKTVIEEIKNGHISAPETVAKKRFRIKVTGHGGEYAAVKASADEIQGWINCYNKDYGDFLDAVDCSEKYSCHTTGVLVDYCEVTVTDLDTDEKIELSEWDAPGDCENEFIELDEDEFCIACFDMQEGIFFEFEVEDYEFDVNKLQVFTIETRFGDIYVNFEYSEDPIADDCFDGTGYNTRSEGQEFAVFDANGDEYSIEEFGDNDCEDDCEDDCEEIIAEAIQCYEQAEKSGAKTDKEKAFACLNKVYAEAASAEATYLLGMCYIREWGCKKDHQKAFDLFVQASKMGCPKANWKLGLYYEGKCNVVETDYKKACELYTAAAEAGIVEAQRLLGRLYLQLGQIDAGKKWLHSAIHGDDDKAKNILAAHYIRQVRVTDERIAVTPNIDANNLRMANLEYAIPYGIYNGPDELMDNALVLIGDSDPKGIESGVLLTTRGIYSQEKSLFKKTQHSAKITAGTQISMPDDTLYVDAEPFFKFKKTSTEQIRNLLAAFKQYQKFL